MELDRVKAEMRKEEQELARRLREGEITDVKDPKVRTPRHQQLIDEFERLSKREKELIVKEELDRIYTAAGATGVNAGTSEDWTIYFGNFPSNKLELWYWMESDRLLHPVFREFYSERDVVHEERRRSIDSTPTGRYMEQFDAMFWKSSPYHWPVVGWPSDLEAITREDAVSYFGVNYAPNNLVACLVGDFEPAQAIAFAKQYFGRLPRGAQDPEPVRTLESPQLAEQRMTAYAETNPQAIIRYHTVAHGHKDEPALDVLADLMNDRTGRLYKSLVLEQQVANMASASHINRKYEGFFEFRGIAKPGKDARTGGAGDLQGTGESAERAGRRARVAEGEESTGGVQFPPPAVGSLPHVSTAHGGIRPGLAHAQHRSGAHAGRDRGGRAAGGEAVLRHRQPQRPDLLYQPDRPAAARTRSARPATEGGTE